VTGAEPAKLPLPIPMTKSSKTSTPEVKVPTTKAPTPTSKAPSPAVQQVDNQKLADLVASKLADSPVSQTVADLQMLTENGVVTMIGTCQDESQKKAVLNLVSKVEGVKLVRDGLKVGTAKVEAPKAATAPVKQAQMLGGPLAAPAPVGVPPTMIGGGGNPDIEPMPIGPAGGGAMGAPPLPNHAWPTYAPYPNMSRVAYPTAYPYNAFPFIGPYYPFPKVPLGWRSVNLTWEDGHWWLGRKSTPQDYWRVKFGY
jgi:hypothetical protein